MKRMASALLGGLALLAPLCPAAAEDDGGDRWPQIESALFEQRPIADGRDVVALDAPARAEDAAVVPITIRSLIAQTPERYIKTITLIIDNNPAPVASVFHFAPINGRADIATRVRVDQYTNMRVVAETSDGKLWMTSRFVKAAGGCSAPAGKDPQAAAARLGRMKLVQPAELKPGQPNTFQLLFSHPNSSGMQFDQMTRLYIPPHYVKSVDITYGGAEVLRVDTDISLSEDPSFHFTFIPDKPGELKAVIVDSKDKTYTGDWQIAAVGQ